MNAETLTALKRSIEHWERLACGTIDEGIGPGSCHLCKLFNPYMTGSKNQITRLVIGKEKEVVCYGCPVMESGNGKDRNLCDNTPYEHAAYIATTASKEGPAFIAAAKAELDFLKSLLPKDA